ncbi:MAG TPA: hypothetical protein VJK02_00250 [Anaerolineales bacterium]|nr:hypothetical protein [Anaerolineales bacterium]
MFGILAVVGMMALGLTGCGTTGQATGDGATVTGGAGVDIHENYTDALPAATQLVVGTLKLEETDLAITADQAQGLVPLWQAYRSLLTSQTSAQQELEALVGQIEEAMTADQLAEIAGMKLTAADMQTVFRDRNPQGQSQTSGTRTPGQNGGGFAGGGGGFPGGGFPGGGSFGGLAPGQTPNPQVFETLRAERVGTSGVNPGLVSVLIEFLQQKSGGTPTPAPIGG